MRSFAELLRALESYDRTSTHQLKATHISQSVEDVMLLVATLFLRDLALEQPPATGLSRKSVEPLPLPMVSVLWSSQGLARLAFLH